MPQTARSNFYEFLSNKKSPSVYRTKISKNTSFQPPINIQTYAALLTGSIRHPLMEIRSQMQLGRDFHLMTPHRTFTVSDSLQRLFHGLLSSLSLLGFILIP